jgi:hypothetical protein
MACAWNPSPRLTGWETNFSLLGDSKVSTTDPHSIIGHYFIILHGLFNAKLSVSVISKKKILTYSLWLAHGIQVLVSQAGKLILVCWEIPTSFLLRSNTGEEVQVRRLYVVYRIYYST